MRGVGLDGDGGGLVINVFGGIYSYIQRWSQLRFRFVFVFKI
jgi:hypothetical protein